MLAVSTIRSDSTSSAKDGRDLCEGDQMEASATATTTSTATNYKSFSMDDFPDLSGTGNLLDSIDFNDLFVGINDGDVLPDLEMDPYELLAEFSVSRPVSGEEEESFSGGNNYQSGDQVEAVAGEGYDRDSASIDYNYFNHKDNIMGYRAAGEINCSNVSDGGGHEEMKNGGDKDSTMATSTEEEIESKKVTEVSISPADCKKVGFFSQTNLKKSNDGKKLSWQGKNNNASNNNCSNNTNNSTNKGKRKTRVDWTPELHRRFVHAVEQLGVDKAVPSRILELMGIDCLTRHNIASHLQKYRTHRKHLLAREAETASWTQKRHMYGMAVAPAAGGTGAHAGCPWNSPTMGFPSAMTQPPPMHHHPSFRALHVWGHPTSHHMEPRHQQPMMPMWPKHRVVPPSPSLPPLPLPPHTWLEQPPLPADPSFWHSHHQRVSNGTAPATPFFPQPLRFPAPPVPGIPRPPPPPPHPATGRYIDETDHGAGNPPLDFHPTKESIDAAIGDVLSKPWLPLPVGLKPPLVDSVLVELQRQGITEIPPSTTCA